MTVDLDANIGTLRLPVKLDVGDVEQIPGTNDFLRGNTHHRDAGGIAADFGRPEAKELFVLLDTLAVDGGR